MRGSPELLASGSRYEYVGLRVTARLGRLQQQRPTAPGERGPGTRLGRGVVQKTLMMITTIAPIISLLDGPGDLLARPQRHEPLRRSALLRVGRRHQRDRGRHRLWLPHEGDGLCRWFEAVELGAVGGEKPLEQVQGADAGEGLAVELRRAAVPRNARPSDSRQRLSNSYPWAEWLLAALTGRRSIRRGRSSSACWPPCAARSPCRQRSEGRQRSLRT